MKRLELFQDGLYQKAKREPEQRFDTLHDKLCRIDYLEEAWKAVSSNRGSAGIDNQSVEDIRAYGVDKFLSELQTELKEETYTVESVKRVFIPKDNGKKRPLGIPTVKDRVVQQTVKQIIEPIFEADFKDFSYAYRKGKSAIQASRDIWNYLNLGYTNVVEIDIKEFFEHINHERMIFLVMKRIADPYIIKLIREWLRAGIVFHGSITNPTVGTPQGGVISPLLANIYLNEMDRVLAKRIPNSDARIIRYADDEIILVKGSPEKYLELAGRMLELLDLELNTDKTEITDAARGFDFLGIHYQRKYSYRSRKNVIRAYPSQKSMKKFREKVKEITKLTKTHVRTMGSIINDLNVLIRGWTNYFNHTNATKQYHALEQFTEWKVSKFYCDMHKIPMVSYRKENRSIARVSGLMRMTGRISYL